MNSSTLTYKQHFKETVRLALPISIGQLGHILLGVTDSLMVGRVGAVPLAASSLVHGLVMLIVVFGLGLTLAISPLVAIERGKGIVRECGVILRQALLLNVVSSFVLVFVIYFLADLIPLLNQAEDVAERAVSYAKIIAISTFPFMIFQTYRQFIEGLSIMKPAMYVTLVAIVVNIFANWVFIYGNLGMPAMELDGAGYATVISRTFMAIVLMIYVLRSPFLKKFDAGLHFRRLDWQIIKELVRLGVPSGFQHFFEIGAFAISAIMIGWMGSSELAAHQIALSLASISFMIILGVSSAATVRVGNALGRNDSANLRKAGFTGVFMAASIMACFGIIFVVFRNWLPLVFIDDATVISITATLLIIAALFQISDGMQAAGLGVLRGIKDVKIPTLITMFAYWIIGLPVGYLLGFTFDMGVIGVWVGFFVGLTIAAVFFFWRFSRKTKKPLAAV